MKFGEKSVPFLSQKVTVLCGFDIIENYVTANQGKENTANVGTFLVIFVIVILLNLYATCNNCS